MAAGPARRENHSFDIRAAGRAVCTDGATHTFTAVGETFTFTVPYPLGTTNVGDTIVLSVSEAPPRLGSEGDTATATVADCSIAVPTIPLWGLGLLALLLVRGGTTLLTPGAQVSAASSVPVLEARSGGPPPATD